jgi:hypothetical protein
MKRAVTWGFGLLLLCGVVGRLMERLGVMRCDCAPDCWCRRPGLSTFRWVLPLGHRPVTEPVAVFPRPTGEDARDDVPRAPRYWLYKKKNDEGTDVFSSTAPVEWGGHHTTRSAEVARTLNDGMAVGDVVVAYQTDLKAVVGYLRLARIEGPRDGRRLFVEPLHRMDPPFPIHEHKAGTTLAGSPAVQGMVMLRELSAEEMGDLVRLSGAPAHVLRGGGPSGAAY